MKELIDSLAHHIKVGDDYIHLQFIYNEYYHPLYLVVFV